MEAVNLDYKAEQDRSKPLSFLIQNSKMVYENITREIQDTKSFVANCKHRRELPKSGVHFYAKTAKHLKKAEKVLSLI